jgi:hypothetical protein
MLLGPSQWLRGLRHGSAAARLLGLWVWVPPGAWLSVCCECCVLLGRRLCVGLIAHPEESYWVWHVQWSLIQRSPTECGMSNECDRKAPYRGAMTQNWVKAPREIKNMLLLENNWEVMQDIFTPVLPNLYTLSIFYIHILCLAHLILLYVTTPIIFSQEYKLFFLPHHPVTSFFIVPIIFLQTVFWKILNHSLSIVHQQMH